MLQKMQARRSLCRLQLRRRRNFSFSFSFIFSLFFSLFGTFSRFFFLFAFLFLFLFINLCIFANAMYFILQTTGNWFLQATEAYFGLK